MEALSGTIIIAIVALIVLSKLWNSGLDVVVEESTSQLAESIKTKSVTNELKNAKRISREMSKLEAYSTENGGLHTAKSARKMLKELSANQPA